MAFKNCILLSRWCCWKIQGRGAPRACCTVWSNFWAAVDEVFSSIGGRSSRPHFYWPVVLTKSWQLLYILKSSRLYHWFELSILLVKNLDTGLKKRVIILPDFPYSRIYQQLKVPQKLVLVVVLNPTTFVVAWLRHYGKIFWHILL